MSDLEQLYNNVKNFNINDAFVSVFREAKIARFVLDLNRNDQLFVQGVGVNGEVVGTYSFMTQELSSNISGKGYPKRYGEPYNFYSTGELYNSFSIRVEKDGFIINADTSDLIGSSIIQSKDEIIGLTKESIEELAKEIIEPLAKEVRKSLLR